MRRINSGQSVVEYVVIFAIVVTLSIIMIPIVLGIPGKAGIFSTYVTKATEAMK